MRGTKNLSCSALAVFYLYTQNMCIQWQRLNLFTLSMTSAQIAAGRSAHDCMDDTLNCEHYTCTYYILVFMCMYMYILVFKTKVKPNMIFGLSTPCSIHVHTLHVHTLHVHSSSQCDDWLSQVCDKVVTRW